MVVPKVSPGPPALRVFPTLNRFHRQRYAPFMPRRVFEQTDPGRAKEHRYVLNSVYHDLGVLVFAGANDSQVSRIAALLKRLTDAGGPQRMWPYERGWRRWKTIRLPQQDILLDEAWTKQEGSLGVLGIQQLAPSVTSEILRDVNGRCQKGTGGAIRFRIDQFYTASRSIARSVVHPTANGPRVLPLDAQVYVSKFGEPPSRKAHQVMVILATAGTSQFVGSFSFVLLPYRTEKEDRRPITSQEVKVNLFGDAEKLESRQLEVSRIVSELRKLEEEIWKEKYEMGQTSN